MRTALIHGRRYAAAASIHGRRCAAAVNIAALIGVLCCAPSVRAEGGTLMPGGSLAVARAGAVAADPSDAMTLLHNPAGLTQLRDHQGHYGVDIAIDALCVQRYGYYGWGIALPEMRAGSSPNADAHRSEFGDPASAAYGLRPFGRVCNSGQFGTLPQLSVTLKLFERLSVGLGLVTPVTLAASQWGGRGGTVAADSGAALPTPTRYALVRQQVRFALDPTLGVAYRVAPWLSLGVSLQATMAALDSDVIMALRAGTSPATDVMTRLRTADYFMPSVTLGAYASPSEYLRIAATFNYAQGFDGAGDITFTTNYYHAGAIDDEFVPYENAPVSVARIRVPQPWTATLAIRYVQPSAEADSGDPLRNERWDVEFDASYIGSGSLPLTTVEVANDFNLEFRRANAAPEMPVQVKKSDLQQLSVDRHGLDSYALRLGGSWNVLPGGLQASAGAFYQSRSVQADYVNIDNFGLTRLGLSLGLKVRMGPLELMASYAHIFQETLDVAPPPHEPHELATDDPHRGFDQRISMDGQASAQPVPDPRVPARIGAIASARQTAVLQSADMRAQVINAGRYTAGFDVISVALTHRF
jgi:hypothetical protein